MHPKVNTMDNYEYLYPDRHEEVAEKLDKILVSN